MSDLFDKLLDLLWIVGLSIPVLFGMGIWLFYSIKKSQEEQDRKQRETEVKDS